MMLLQSIASTCRGDYRLSGSSIDSQYQSCRLRPPRDAIVLTPLAEAGHGVACGLEQLGQAQNMPHRIAALRAARVELYAHYGLPRRKLPLRLLTLAGG